MTHTPSCFVAHSFAPDDKPHVNSIKSFIESFGIAVVTGEEPSPAGISEKVKARIQSCDIFAAVFSRRRTDDSPHGTSPWLLEERVFALGARKPVLLFIEDGVEYFSGLTPDYEHISFTRRDTSGALTKSVPYVLAALKGIGSQMVTDTSIDAIDDFEAKRIIAKIEAGSRLTPTQDSELQNTIFRQAMISFVAVELEGNYSAFLFLLHRLSERGFKISPISRMLFDKYYKMGLQAQDDTRLALRAGLKT